MTWVHSIQNYVPYNNQELKDKELILSAINNYNNLLTRENVIMHITSSGYIVNKKRDKVLMIYHKIYNSWAWTGGHADGDDDLLYVAIKEAKEETGLKNVTAVTPEIFSLDVLTVDGHIKRGEYVSSHLHLNVTYLLEADEKEALTVNEEETKGVKWLPINELSKYCSEPYIIENVYNKLNKKINLL
ncbi:NUDIX hydrolase [Clostridium septicum]|uniref:NUDIX hydrolase n=2 Tax=Clostridium septicum TaxID=1504 RepID=A0A9N7JJQ0_CLOSE|nr:NUDIX hydrolase [Clostridium septicum]AYE33738.1 NUDIX hydrolase [Clostridium septicum]MDU1315159.1 NUDIX hydrolase [Clostridium septicum]QAS61895.1 NUDIX domain-containing protein [Clostridium septicum]UEC21650.1 NUDIX hydrolase [Clostridium septicum]USS00300.1 NUDIX hydrolase [Clostridium septicum]